MSLTGAQQAVVDCLAAGPGPVTWSSPASPGGWAASTRSGGGEGADPATVDFRKSRAFAGCQLHSVDCATRLGSATWLVRTWQEPDGSWTAAPIGGGGAEGPQRSRPWVNFAAQWNAAQFAAGGQVAGAGAQQARRVRLVFADGTELADSVDNGVVLFFTAPGVAFPAQVTIHGAAGEVLASYVDFDGLD
jgi:hypothetical protein